MYSQTQLLTTEAARIGKRLFNHWKHKFEVVETEQHFQILMPTATVTLTPQDNTLDVRVSLNQQNKFVLKVSSLIT